MKKDLVEVRATNAKTLRGTLSPNENPVAGAVQVFPVFKFDAGRATRVAKKRPTSHTLLSTKLFISDERGKRKGKFTNLVRGKALLTIRSSRHGRKESPPCRRKERSDQDGDAWRILAGTVGGHACAVMLTATFCPPSAIW